MAGRIDGRLGPRGVGPAGIARHVPTAGSFTYIDKDNPWTYGQVNVQ
jgi:hypothetical protein